MEKTIQVKNLKIRILDKGQGTPFLILHGWGKGLETWRKVAEILAQKFRVVIPDLPGFGKSQIPPADWGIEQYCDFVQELVKGLSFQEIILLGHSFGGRIAVKLASDELKDFSIKKLILVDSAGIKKRKIFLTAVQYISKALKHIPPFTFPWVKKIFYRKILKSDYFDANPQMKKVLENILQEDLKEELPRISIPTLIIWGKKDKITPLKDAYVFHQLISNSFLEILNNIGHSPHIEAPELLTSSIIKFLSKE